MSNAQDIQSEKDKEIEDAFKAGMIYALRRTIGEGDVYCSKAIDDLLFILGENGKPLSREEIINLVHKAIGWL